jgi:hypothetical protein
MPLEITDPAAEAAVEAILASGQPEWYEALDIVFRDGVTRHLCETRLNGVDTEEFGLVDYTADLRTVGQLTESLTLQANTLEFQVQNVDGVIGQNALGQPRALNGAIGIYSNIFIGDDGTKYRIVITGGVIQNADSTRPNAGFKLYDHLSQPGPIFGRRALQQHCTIPLFGGPGCSSPSAVGGRICTRLKDGEFGCSDQEPAPQLTTPVPGADEGNTDRFQGFSERKEPVAGATVSDPGGIVDRGGDFNTWLDETDFYRGRHEIPY